MRDDDPTRWPADRYPAGRIVLVCDTTDKSPLTMTWRPARVIRRTGPVTWLVRHDDCICWCYDDGQPSEIRPARPWTFLHYAATQLLVRAHGRRSVPPT